MLPFFRCYAALTQPRNHAFHFQNEVKMFADVNKFAACESFVATVDMLKEQGGVYPTDKYPFTGYPYSTVMPKEAVQLVVAQWMERARHMTLTV